MTDICAGCRKPIVNVKPVKCMDMLYRVTESDRTMMKRVIELSREGNEQ